MSDNQARDQVSEATLALDGDGRFLALRVAAITNLGAYVTAAGAGIATENFAKCFPGMYDIPHVFVGVRLAFTNTVPDRTLSRRRSTGGELRHGAPDRRGGARKSASIQWSFAAAT